MRQPLSRAIWRPRLAARMLAVGFLVASPAGALVVMRAFAATAAATAPNPVQGFLVSPTRVVFTDLDRNAQITLVNHGPETGLYRLSITRMRMALDGRIVEIETAEPGEQFADTLVRFSPRQVELEPGTPQTVRLQFRLPPDLPPGEYRSHLLIRAVPRLEAPVAPDSAVGSEVRILLTPIFGAAIPVIVRHGRTEATVAIEQATLVPAKAAGEPDQVAFELTRSGTRSVYGDITVSHQGQKGRRQVVARLKGVAVYTPNPRRRLEIPLQSPAGDLGPGRLEVRFEESGHGHVPVAIAAIDLP